MVTERLTQAAAIFAASALLGGCAQFTGSDDVSLDGDPISSGDNGDVIAPLPPAQEISCAYPFAELYNAAVGSVMDPNIAWNGLAPLEEVARNVPITEMP